MRSCHSRAFTLSQKEVLQISNQGTTWKSLKSPWILGLKFVYSENWNKDIGAGMSVKRKKQKNRLHSSQKLPKSKRFSFFLICLWKKLKLFNVGMLSFLALISLSVRDTRWKQMNLQNERKIGMCSSVYELTFNLRTVIFPQLVLRFVLVWFASMLDFWILFGFSLKHF